MALDAPLDHGTVVAAQVALMPQQVSTILTNYMILGKYITATGSTYDSSVSCGAGTTSGSGQNTCNTIPSGYHATTTSATPQPCPDGFYSTGASTSYKCVVCPAGYYCSSGNVTPTQITGNIYYQTQGKSYKSSVPPGHYRNGNSLPPIPCASKGYYWVAASGSCTICAVGYACPSSTMTTQVPCPSGFYSDAQGQYECSSCPAGKYCSTASSQIDCAAGSYSLGF